MEGDNENAMNCYERALENPPLCKSAQYRMNRLLAVCWAITKCTSDQLTWKLQYLCNEFNPLYKWDKSNHSGGTQRLFSVKYLFREAKIA